MSGLVKRLLRSKGAVRFAADTIALYIRFVHATSRWEVHGQQYPDSFWNAGKPFILCFWHGRLLMIPKAWNLSRPIKMLISQHRDGELIARAMDPFGIGTVRGSGSKKGKEKGGSAALRVIVKILKDNGYAGFTPDGPRGPRMRVASPGVIAAARLAKTPILPVTYAVARRKVIGSWDRFILPWPFNRGVFLWGEPIDVHSNADEPIEAAMLRLEAAMNELCDRADRLCGQEPIEPAAAQPQPAESNV
ncbi:MAG TPA: lysophospholipid acyltransferase family protein [Ferrovibrio sp.]|uniref:lysophospholipid acyltransferase family protein n=1 Tax=Ferrovibrio sp. TaxID=1917215 RepID=UPI002B4B4B13|nr:lysophospholipid acyltransferase family protein [Ferrovibrio sp.]HLT77848.1 lysophospholipid acyltransferase family protein [Ferrovibrio sp.]